MNFYLPQTKLWEGNFFTRVCRLSLCPQEGRVISLVGQGVGGLGTDF